MRMKLLASALAVVALAAGCGSATETTEEPKGEVVIAMENWAGYEANAAVLGYLLKNELGYDVEYSDLGGTKTWDALEAGEIDIIAEDWGKYDALMSNPETSESSDWVVRARYTGVRGQIGWWMPAWMAKKYPGIDEADKLSQFVDVLKTEASGDKIQLLVGDANYVSNDQEIIESLGLPVEVVAVDGEDKLIEAARKSAEGDTPILFYFWSPHWLFAEMDLVPMQFQTYDDKNKDCTKRFKCGYEQMELVTVVSRDFAETGGDAYQLVKNFNWTADDQSQVAFDISEGGMAPEDAAKKWLDSHADQWQTWVTS